MQRLVSRSLHVEQRFGAGSSPGEGSGGGTQRGRRHRVQRDVGGTQQRRQPPEIGLAQLQTLSWRSDPSVAKVAFWVADAPQHDDRGPNMNQAIAGARDAGIHVYPVSASGTNDLLECTMRTTALMTGGRYLFLADDSGVGDSRKIPEIPCFYVTLLEKALVRVASMEISGNYIAPDVSEIIRVSGDPAPDGTCSDFNGGVVKIF
ncbi:MAG TPA: hypothetical protein VKU41_03065 [Polyangiaceae bacterium]|nr:hypothetical protein [Polyangiaceae bacterium]